jgi:hypothetical protein
VQKSIGILIFLYFFISNEESVSFPQKHKEKRRIFFGAHFKAQKKNKNAVFHE